MSTILIAWRENNPSGYSYLVCELYEQAHGVRVDPGGGLCVQIGGYEADDIKDSYAGQLDGVKPGDCVHL